VENYIPEINDTVTTILAGHSGGFTVIRVDVASKTADLQAVPASATSSYILASMKWRDIQSSVPTQSSLAS
jgi:hypothetical protein